MTGRHGRLSKLEAERAEWRRKHLPLAEVFFYLEHMFQIVQEETLLANSPRTKKGRTIGHEPASRSER